MLEQESWFDSHKSSIFIFKIFTIGLFLALVGIFISENKDPLYQNPYFIFFGKLLIELAIACIAGGIAAIFLSFREVKEQLATIVGSLFSKGDIVELLSTETRDLLYNKILYERVKKNTAHINQNLFNQLQKSTDQFYEMEHIYNYIVEQKYTNHSQKSNLIVTDATRSFRLQISHLSFPREVTYKFVYSVSFPLSIEINEGDFLLEFYCKFDNKEFDKNNKNFFSMIDKKEPKERILGFRFEPTTKKRHGDGDIDVILKYRAVIPKNERTTSTIARYPTCGFRVSITHSLDYDYDCTWFKSQEPKYEDFPGVAEVFHTNGGITAVSNLWVLPGEGTCISWKNKENN